MRHIKPSNAYKHGMSRTRLYSLWSNLNQRCYDKKCLNYKTYKGRGYDPWKQFIPFMEWALNNGYREGLSLDRINNDQGYSPDNCQWITKENHRKKSDRENIKAQCKRGHDTSYKDSRNKSGNCKECVLLYK